MAGHMGDRQVTVRNLRVIRVDADNNLLLVEDFISRESLGEESGDPTAPPAAGE